MDSRRLVNVDLCRKPGSSSRYGFELETLRIEVKTYQLDSKT